MNWEEKNFIIWTLVLTVFVMENSRDRDIDDKEIKVLQPVKLTKQTHPLNETGLYCKVILTTGPNGFQVSIRRNHNQANKHTREVRNLR